MEQGDIARIKFTEEMAFLNGQLIADNDGYPYIWGYFCERGGESSYTIIAPHWGSKVDDWPVLFCSEDHPEPDVRRLQIERESGFACPSLRSLRPASCRTFA